MPRNDHKVKHTNTVLRCKQKRWTSMTIKSLMMTLLPNCIVLGQPLVKLETAHLDRKVTLSPRFADEGIAEAQNGVEVIVIDDMSDISDLEVVSWSQTQPWLQKWI